MCYSFVTSVTNACYSDIICTFANIDAVGRQIIEGGYVSNWKLFRRWVMSQMFHMLRDMDKSYLS